MLHKIVINNCYGGFSLSTLAIKRYYELKYPEVQLSFYKLDFPLDLYQKVPMEEADVILTKDLGDSFTGSLGDDYWVDDHIFDRHDSILVQVVEISGNKYRICEYDGQEWIETPESIDWVTIT